MICGAVLLAFTAAFGVIDHKLLLEKLECYGFRPSAAACLVSYLVNRVFFNQSYSGSVSVECGLPQRSCLGPLLYSIFTIDLPLVLKKHPKLTTYTDDTTVYAVCYTYNDS